MSLSDLLIMHVKAPRHSWRWLLEEIKALGVNTETLEEWLRQVRIGVPLHTVGATVQEINRIREDHCDCEPDPDVIGDNSEGGVIRCASCAVIDEILAHVNMTPDHGPSDRSAS